jgi:hypothetical protein
MFGAVWAWAVRLIGLGRLVTVLVTVGVAGAGMLGFYIKGRMDCASSYEVAIRDQTIAALEQQIASIQDAQRMSTELFKEFQSVERDNDQIEYRLSERPVVGCVDGGWLRELSNIK